MPVGAAVRPVSLHFPIALFISIAEITHVHPLVLIGTQLSAARQTMGQTLARQRGVESAQSATCSRHWPECSHIAHSSNYHKVYSLNVLEVRRQATAGMVMDSIPELTQ
jgi:hypothetical protein